MSHPPLLFVDGGFPTSDLLACADERETIIARLMQTYRLSRPEACDMLEQFGDITETQDDPEH